MDTMTKRSENHMKNLFRIFASVRSVHTTKTGRASEALRHKSLIINDQILHSPPKASGNVRFCVLTAPTHPGPIRGNPKLRAEM